MRYFLNPIFEGKKYSFNATKKAPDDIAQILLSNGWKKIDFSYGRFTEASRVFRYFYVLWLFLKIYFRLGKGDILFLQYPYFPVKHFFFFMSHSLKRYSLIILIHDLSDLRYENGQTYYPVLKYADFVIAHTEKMKDYLVSKGLRSERVKVLYFFDYLVAKDRIGHSNLNESVTFAGNLAKSGFLSKIPELDDLQNIHFYLFGTNSPSDFENVKNIDYCGKFSPDDLSLLKGKWGLLWDGMNTTSCVEDGVKFSVGSYLRYNSSHKLSLYIAAQMPIIIWKEASLANFIVENHLGVAISSLSEIPNAIALTSELSKFYNESIIEYSEKVKTGQMLLAALSQCK